MTAVRRFLTILTLSLAAVAALAQQPATTQRTTEPVTAETDQDVQNARALRLSLDEAVRTSMTQNLGISIQRYDYLMAGQSLRSQYGIYDWYTTGKLEHSSAEFATSNSLQSASERSTTANVGISQTVPTGGSYAFNFNNEKTNKGGFGTLVNPTYNSNFGVSLNQPLLRDFGIDVTNRFINIAHNTLGINKELFRSVLMNTAVSVEQAYLDLVYARRNVDVVKDSLFLARDQSRITQIRIDVGASAPLDILQPRVQIATTEEQLIAAVASVRDAEDRLRALLNLPAADWDRPIIPTDDVAYKPMDLSMDAAVAQALSLRPEVRENQLTTATRRIEYLYARNQVRPRVDAVASLGAAGLAGSALATDPITGQPTGLRSTAYPQALKQIVGGDFPSWSVGVNLAMPILNIGARAEAKRAQLDYEQSKATEDQTRQNIQVDVRKAVRDIDTAAKEIVASRTAREAAEQNLDAERKRYENGMTTNFNVLQIQQQLSDARVRELQALVGYNKAVANYHRAVGDLLEFRSIKVEDDTPEEPKIFGRFFDRYSWLNYGNKVNLEEPAK
jgi:HAE1 family hydrophobic/amphiphilic exporter-1